MPCTGLLCGLDENLYAIIGDTRCQFYLTSWSYFISLSHTTSLARDCTTNKQDEENTTTNKHREVKTKPEEVKRTWIYLPHQRSAGMGPRTFANLRLSVILWMLLAKRFATQINLRPACTRVRQWFTRTSWRNSPSKWSEYKRLSLILTERRHGMDTRLSPLMLHTKRLIEKPLICSFVETLRVTANTTKASPRHLAILYLIPEGTHVSHMQALFFLTVNTNRTKKHLPVICKLTMIRRLTHGTETLPVAIAINCDLIRPPVLIHEPDMTRML